MSSEGRGRWATADAGYTWSIRNVSGLNHLMGTAGESVLLVAKAQLGMRERFSQLLWIQYTEALLDGKIYTPPATAQRPEPWPWNGLDRYPNNNRPDSLPYSNLPDEQARTDAGAAYHGRIRGLYEPQGADSVFVDWASSGGMANWAHYSVLSLIGRGWSGEEWTLGSLTWGWSADSSGSLTTLGARPSNDEDRATWLKGLGAGSPEYANQVFRGDYQG